MVNYENSIIYKICCKDTNVKDEYVGSTTNFKQRKIKHKSDCSRFCTTYLYSIINEKGGWFNWEMIELEKYKAVDRLDLHKRERYYIEKFGSNLNITVPTRTQKEYKQTEQRKKYKKEFRQTEKYKNYQKEYYQSEKGKNKQKDYRQSEKGKNKQKEYRQIIQCDICKKNMTLNNSRRSRHINSKFHQKALANINK